MALNGCFSCHNHGFRNAHLPAIALASTQRKAAPLAKRGGFPVKEESNSNGRYARYFSGTWSMVS